MIAPDEACKHGQVIREPLPIRIASCNKFLDHISCAAKFATSQYSRGYSNFAQPVQGCYRYIKLDKHVLFAAMGNKTSFLLSDSKSGYMPLRGLKMPLEERLRYFDANCLHRCHSKKASQSLRLTGMR